MTGKDQDAPIRVLFNTTALGGGGAEMQLLRVANHLDRDRFAPSVFVARAGGNYEADLRPDTPLHSPGHAAPLAAARELRRVVRREKPDVVCSFLDIPAAMAWAATRGIAGPPALVSCVQAPPTITWAGSAWTRSGALRRLLAFHYQRAERIVAISAGVADDLRRFAPRSAARTEVVYNVGVDERVRAGAQVPLDPTDVRPEGPLVVACGRLVPQKGFGYLLGAFARVRARVPNATLWIVGEGADRPLLERMIGDLGLEGSARLLGYRNDPYRYMAAADLFVLSSVFEGFGNVVVEAMACGAPVVATDCPHGPAEIIRDGVNGILVPPRDEPALADAVVRVLQDPVLAERLGRAGRARAQDFDALRITAAYEDVFARLASARRDRGARGTAARRPRHAGLAAR